MRRGRFVLLVAAGLLACALAVDTADSNEASPGSTEEYTPEEHASKGPIGPCRAVGTDEKKCAVSCSSPEGTGNARHPYLVLSLSFEDEAPVASLLNLMTYTRHEASKGGAGLSTVDIDTCKAGSGSAMSAKAYGEAWGVSKGWIEGPTPQWFVSNTSRGKPTQRFLKPCEDPGREEDCWISCRTSAGAAPIPGRLVSLNDDYTSMEFQPLSSGETMTLGKALMNTCKKSSIAFEHRNEVLGAGVQDPVQANPGGDGDWFVSSYPKASGDDLKLRPCERPLEEPQCWASCPIDFKRIAVQILSISNDKTSMVVGTGNGERVTLPLKLMNLCKRSTTAWNSRNQIYDVLANPQVPLEHKEESYPTLAKAPLPTEVPVGSDEVLIGNVWDEEYKGPRREQVMDKGLPIGGHNFVKLRNLYSVLNLAAPMERLRDGDLSNYKGNSQRIYEAPYTLPRYRIEINVVSGDVFVSMPVSKRWRPSDDDSSAPSRPTAVEYVKKMFDTEGGTLPMGVADMTDEDKSEFSAHCSWKDTAYLWAVVPMMNREHDNIDEDHFRLVISPECAYTFNKRLIKHGDLVPLETPVGRVHGDKKSSPAIKVAHIHHCYEASKLFMTGEGEGYMEPSWEDAVSTTTLFQGNCRGPANMAGELYADNGSRAARKDEKIFSEEYDTFKQANPDSSEWLVDADSGYTFARDGGKYTGVEAMVLMKVMLAGMHINTDHFWVNTAGTKASLQTDRQYDFKVSRDLIDTESDLDATPLARVSTLRGSLFNLETPQGDDGDDGFPAVLPTDDDGGDGVDEAAEVDRASGKREGSDDGLPAVPPRDDGADEAADAPEAGTVAEKIAAFDGA